MLDACFVLQYLFVLSSFAIILLGMRLLSALVCSKFRVASFLFVPWVGLSYVVAAFPGHIHLPFGFPVASYFCELDIHLYDEQEHMSI